MGALRAVNSPTSYIRGKVCQRLFRGVIWVLLGAVVTFFSLSSVAFVSPLTRNDIYKFLPMGVYYFLVGLRKRRCLASKHELSCLLDYLKVKYTIKVDISQMFFNIQEMIATNWYLFSRLIFQIYLSDLFS